MPRAFYTRYSGGHLPTVATAAATVATAAAAVTTAAAIAAAAAVTTAAAAIAAAAAVTTATAIATTAAVTTAATAARTAFTWFCLFYNNCTTIKFRFIDCLDSGICLLIIRHIYKGEALGTTGKFVSNNGTG